MSDERAESLEIHGELSLFGFPPEKAILWALPRSRRWRGIRAVAYVGGGLLLAPVLGVVPPHAPWVLGALGLGGVLGVRKWREWFTLVSFQGRCPKCGAAMTLKAGTPVRPSLSVPCDGCHHDSRLTVAASDIHPARSGSPSSSGAEVPASGAPGQGGREK